MTTQPLFRHERPADAPLVEALVARAFGPGRFAKTAERLRESNAPILDLSVVALIDRRLVGCARIWPVAVDDTPVLMLGPFAVEPAYRSLGLGAALIERACDAAAKAGHALVILVGDEPYFAPLGFSAEPARRIHMPGPVDQRRVLARALVPGAAGAVAGAVSLQRVDSGPAEPHQLAQPGQNAAVAYRETLPSGV